MSSKKPGFFTRIKSLSFEQQLTFATVLSERMLPNYQLFSQSVEFGSPKVLNTIVDLLWQKLAKQSVKLNLEVQQNKLLENTPELADFDNFGVIPAIDCAMALNTILVALEQKLDEDLINISKLSSSTVASYISAVEGDISDEDTFSHEMMVEEKALQEYLLSRIEEQPKLAPAFLKELRQEFKGFGVSNIGIEA
ncbi:YjaG family protein [Psychrobium sp. MM17-31]|uniref:YjaG family protein n=1 Tax=Psychrobium sp. MM17-31 TaxID=2917758 RepID=UPI001EF60326|nr:YjaG family protein [Psychrobium sp. MM17-31]MCG7529875.1 YjaG family protein [Psychrobium sp. MM17-31]